MKCGICDRDLVRGPDGTLYAQECPSSTVCDIRNNGFDAGLPHIEKTEWMLHGLNSHACGPDAGEGTWWDLIYGLLTAEERAELRTDASRPQFRHDGVTYARGSDGRWQLKAKCLRSR